MSASRQPTHQYAMTVVVPVADGRFDELRRLLARISDETVSLMQRRPVSQPLFPFEKVGTLHYGRFFLAPASPRHGDPALLVFATNYDGPEGERWRREKRARRRHMDELIEHCAVGLERVFEHCRDFPAQPNREALRDYLLDEEHQVRAQTFYTGSSGRSRRQILAEWELRKRIEEAADRVRADMPGDDAEVVREAIRKRMAGAVPEPFPDQPRDLWKAISIFVFAGLALAGAWVGLVAWILSGLPGLPLGFGPLAGVAGASLVLVATVLVVTLRIKEKTDPMDVPRHDAQTSAHIEWASQNENLFMQNQITHLAELKDGWFRRVLAGVVFWALQLLARYLFNRGKLGNIPSIHFARWIYLGNANRVLFFSNFDHSWQSYLGDFIDQASTGLTAVWSNTKGYPRTEWLTRAGSRNAPAFLAWTRAHQRPTDVWYSAYPALSIKLVNQNTVVRRGLADPKAMCAKTWLRALAGEDLDLDDKPGTYGAVHEARELDAGDIQGIILKGYGHLPWARYGFFRVTEPGPARAWLAEQPLTSARTAHETKRASKACERVEHPRTHLNVAFTHPGLRALELEQALLDQFPLAFVQGSHHPDRSRILGDVADEAPEHWRWGNEEEAVHVLVLLFADSEARREEAWDALRREAQRNGLEHVTDIEGRALDGRKEHFGFRDGIAQPRIKGNPLDDPTAHSGFNQLAAGEFLLGYPNGYHVPDKDDDSVNVSHAPHYANGTPFAKGGSYLVFRQLSQDVDNFWSDCGKLASSEMNAEMVASKMVGRWPNGEPLTKHPRRPSQPGQPSDEDRFGYLSNGDAHGEKCPFGAHIRRTNPRDWQLGSDRHRSMQLSNLHRIIRRGRPYGKARVRPLEVSSLVSAAHSGEPDHEERGLCFLCFNADIERQFEFVQQQWIQNTQFSGLPAESEPLMGRRHRPAQGIGDAQRTFAIQQSPLRFRCKGLAQYVRLRGSAYFFMPPISAVRALGEGRIAPAG